MNEAVRIRGVLLAAALVACLASGCDRDPETRDPADPAGDVAALPRPETDGGSVTGFDGSAPAPSTTARVEDNDAAAGADDSAIAAAEGEDAAMQAQAIPAPDASATPVQPSTAPLGPGAAEAAAVVRSYYAAINAGQFSRAYALWANGGRASGQSGQQFAGGFSDTARVTATTGEPGRVEGAAGSRYVTVPVAVEAIQDDGHIRHFDGTYTLRRAVVDGATAEQRQWRISDADLREVE